MNNAVDIGQVKQYNATLKQYKDQASKISAEIDFNKKELESICAELTTELGVVVNPDNIEQIYNERVAKIQNTLASGTEILNRIRQESNLV